MNRELKRGPGGFITRDQWVLCGYCQNRPLSNRAYWTQYLWDYGLPSEHGGFSFDDEHLMRQQMEDGAATMVEELRKEIMVGLKSRKDFAIGPNDEIQVTFHRHETEGHFCRVEVRKAGQKPIVIEDDFSENWTDGELGQRVEDAMMVQAAIDPDAVAASDEMDAMKMELAAIDLGALAVLDEEEEDKHPEPTLGDLLGQQLHAISTRNLMPYGNRVLGGILAEKLGELAGPVIAAMEEAQAVIVEDPGLLKRPKIEADTQGSDSNAVPAGAVVDYVHPEYPEHPEPWQ